MIQKTLITDKKQELLTFLDELRADASYASSSDRIMLFSDQNNDVSHLKDEIAVLKEKLPETKFLGVTMPSDGMLPGHETGFRGAGYSMLLTDRAKTELIYYDCSEISTTEAGKRLRREIRYRDHIAGIFVFAAGLEQEIDKFLTTVGMYDKSEVAIIGAQAGADGTSYICGSFSDEPVSCGIAVLIFYGRGLHFYYNYDMGWNAIGKEMTITGTDGNFCATTIDDKPAAAIYKEYLGVEPDEYFTDNVREFPLVTYRVDREVVRTPSGYGDDGRLYFIARVNKGDKVRLSYGNPIRLIERTKLYAETMHSFGPQALFLIICENRARFLKDMAGNDVIVYRNFMNQVAWVRGFAAILMDKKGGGVVNSAIISVGIREGAPSETDLAGSRGEMVSEIRGRGVVPLDQRLAMFLEKTTTELSEMAVEADSANEAKSEFLSQMSHEIRTPINAVLGMNEMILRESRDENITKYAENARAAGMSLLNIISDILDFSKIEAGKMDIVPYEYELSSTIHDLVNLIIHRAEERGLALKVEVDPAIPHVLFGDEVRVKQIITNLLTNAVKYTERGEVTLKIGYEKTAPDEIALKVAVTDTGIGIKPDDMKRLFNTFDRIDQNYARKIEGSGLGLNITQQLLSLMDSKLEVSSVYGKGSTFSFSLIQKVTNWDSMGDYENAVKKKDKKKSKRKAHFKAEDARILVVDDAPMNLEVISGLLRRTEMRVDTAESGMACIDKFGRADYDLVFLDHRMPGMDGIETLHEMKAIYGDDLNGVPVISLTANAVVGAREEYTQAGFSDYLAKPVMPDELEEMLIRYLPEDKIRYLSPEESSDEEESFDIPEWLYDINLIDVESGVDFCGGEEEYLDALHIFYESIKGRSDEIEKCYKDKDWQGYTIKVHALKSMARTVGAKEISNLAAELEAAGKEKNIDAINAGTNVLLTLYRGLIPQLALLDSHASDVQISGDDNAHHVLLVDDDEDFLSLASRWLKSSYRVSTINSGNQALKYLQTVRPDLILLDYAMPVMSGLNVLEKIRENPDIANIPVIFLTGTEDRESVKNAERLHPAGYLLKSVGKAGLITAVNKYFEELH